MTIELITKKFIKVNEFMFEQGGKDRKFIVEPDIANTRQCWLMTEGEVFSLLEKCDHAIFDTNAIFARAGLLGFIITEKE